MKYLLIIPIFFFIDAGIFAQDAEVAPVQTVGEAAEKPAEELAEETASPANDTNDTNDTNDGIQAENSTEDKAAAKKIPQEKPPKSEKPKKTKKPTKPKKVPNISFTINPYIKSEVRFYLSGKEAETYQRIQPDISYAGTIFSIDYNNYLGIQVDLHGSMGDHDSNSYSNGFYVGESFAYVHLLQSLFSVDRKLLDIYLKTGLFDFEPTNAENAGAAQSNWVGHTTYVGNLKFSDAKYNGEHISGVKATDLSILALPVLQLDVVLLEMLTLRAGFRYADWTTDQADQADQALVTKGGQKDSKGAVIFDMSFSLLFEKKLNKNHTIRGSLAYIVDFNENNKYGDEARIGGFGPEATLQDFDELGFTAAYTATFGAIELVPYLNVLLKSVFAKSAKNAHEETYFGWSGGAKLTVSDPAKKAKLLSLRTFAGGHLRGSDKVEAVKFLGIRTEFHFLSLFMGKKYLYLWVDLFFELNASQTGYYQHTLRKYKRASFLRTFNIGIQQYIANSGKNIASIYLLFRLQNLAPYTLSGVSGYFPKAGVANPYKYNNMLAFIEFGFAMDFQHTWKTENILK